MIKLIVLNNLLSKNIGGDIMGNFARKWYYEGREEGREEGERIKTINFAKKLIIDGVANDNIAKWTELTNEEIEKIKLNSTYS